MIDLILIISGVYVLGLLFSQLKINGQQEQFIKAETEALKKLQDINKEFAPTELFGLLPDCSYLKTPATTPNIVEHRQQLLNRQVQRNRNRKEYPVY